MIGDINWSVMLEGGGSITGTTSFDIDDVCWSRMFKPDSGGGGGGDKPWEEMTWDEVIEATKNGKYRSFEVGAVKELDLGSEGVIHMQIVGIDADELADGSGYAPLTFISKELLKTSHRMNPELTPSAAPYTEGTGTIGGWEKSEMRSYLKETVKPLIPENVRNAIKNVTKHSRIFDAAGTAVNDVASVDDVWIPSRHEMFDTSTTAPQLFETKGPRYSEAFPTNESRIKQTTESNMWWLRSAVINFRFATVYNAIGAVNNGFADSAFPIALGFCL